MPNGDERNKTTQLFGLKHCNFAKKFENGVYPLFAGTPRFLFSEEREIKNY